MALGREGVGLTAGPRTPLSEEQTNAQIAALHREREGYIRQGRDDRAAQVDAELARLGYVGQKGAEKRPRGGGKETR